MVAKDQRGITDANISYHRAAIYIFGFCNTQAQMVFSNFRIQYIAKRYEKEC